MPSIPSTNTPPAAPVAPLVLPQPANGSVAYRKGRFYQVHAPQPPRMNFYFFEITAGRSALLAAAAGVAGLVFVAPWMTIGIARVELALARALLGPNADQVHAAQVSRLETSRTAAVDSAESERRRIERREARLERAGRGAELAEQALLGLEAEHALCRHHVLEAHGILVDARAQHRRGLERIVRRQRRDRRLDGGEIVGGAR